MTDKNKIRIKACAHCGSHPNVINTSRWYKRGILFKIQCTGCGIQTPEYNFSSLLSGEYRTFDTFNILSYYAVTLIYKWNKRQDDERVINIKKFLDSQRPMSPELQKILNDNFWDLLS